jgi:hypothetical protein
MVCPVSRLARHLFHHPGKLDGVGVDALGVVLGAAGDSQGEFFIRV